MKSTGRHIRDCSANEVVEMAFKSVVFADAGDFYYSFHREMHNDFPMFCVKKYKKSNREHRKDNLEDSKWFKDVSKFHYYIFRLSAMYQKVWAENWRP